MKQTKRNVQKFIDTLEDDRPLDTPMCDGCMYVKQFCECVPIHRAYYSIKDELFGR